VWSVDEGRPSVVVVGGGKRSSLKRETCLSSYLHVPASIYHLSHISGENLLDTSKPSHYRSPPEMGVMCVARASCFAHISFRSQRGGLESNMQAINQLVMTSPRDFGTGAKWTVYMWSHQLCFSSLSPPSSSCHLEPHLSFLTTQQTDFIDLHWVLMDHTGMKRNPAVPAQVCTPGWPASTVSFFSFLFPILLPLKSAVPPPPPRCSGARLLHSTTMGSGPIAPTLLGLMWPQRQQAA
jgi:hypothetical protein